VTLINHNSYGRILEPPEHWLHDSLLNRWVDLRHLLGVISEALVSIKLLTKKRSWLFHRLCFIAVDWLLLLSGLLPGGLALPGEWYWTG